MKTTMNRHGRKVLVASALSVLALPSCIPGDYKEGRATFIVTCPHDSPDMIAVRGRFHRDVYVFCDEQDGANDASERLAKPLNIEPVSNEPETELSIDPPAHLLHVDFSYPNRGSVPTAEDMVYNDYYSQLDINGSGTIIDVVTEE